MNAFFRDFRLIWQYGGQDQSPAVSPILMRVFSIMWILIGPLIGFGLKSLAMAILTCMAVPTLNWWWRLLQGAARLNPPSCAMLVPHMHARSRNFMLQTWLLLSILSALLVDSRFGHFAWYFLGSGCLFLVLAVFSTGGTWPSRIGVAFLGWAGCVGKSYGLSAIMQNDAVTMLGVLALVALTWYFFQRQFLSKGTPQTAGKAVPTQVALAGVFFQQQFLGAVAPQTARKAAVLAVPELYTGYFTNLRQDCRDGKRDWLLQYLFLAVVPWRNLRALLARQGDSLLFAFIVIAWFIKLILPLCGARIDFIGDESLLGLWLSPLALLLMINRDQYTPAIAHVTTELALYRLSPLVPSRQHFKRYLAMIILRNQFYDWLFRTTVILLATALFGISATTLLLQLAVCLMGLPLIAAPLRSAATSLMDERVLMCVSTLVWGGLIYFIRERAQAGGGDLSMLLPLALLFAATNFALAAGIIHRRLVAYSPFI